MTKKRDFTDRYNELEQSAKAMNETRDCAVKAIAVIGNLSYGDAHCLLQLHGRKNREGTWNYLTSEALKFLDMHTKEETDLWRDTMGCRTVLTLGRAMKGTKGAFLVWVSHHLLAVKDGEIHDWTAGRLHRIQRVERVIYETAANSEGT